MSVTEGLRAVLAFNGGVVALLTGIDFSGSRAQTPFRPMGSYDATQILKGARNFEGAARQGYVCGDWMGSFKTNCTNYAATFYPSGSASCGGIGGTCGSFSATVAIKGYSITGMEMESEAAVIEEITFDAINVTQL